MPIAGADRKIAGKFYDKGGAVVNLQHPDYAGLVTSNNWSPALQEAADDLASTGGTIWIPPTMRYGMDGVVTISSAYPINIISDMSPMNDSFATTPGGSFIYPLTTFAGDMIEYKTPGGGLSRFQAGAGLIRGLQCYDISNPGGGSTKAKRNLSIGAFLGLTDFTFGAVENCGGQYLNGSVIRLDCAVMASVSGCRIRYSGSVGKPAIYVNVTNGTYPTQSTTFKDMRVEVCYDAAYLSLSTNAINNKIINCGFEATVADTDSNQKFINELGEMTQLSGNHFGANSSAYPVTLNKRGVCNGNWFSGHTAGSLSFGNQYAVTGNDFYDNAATYTVNLTGSASTFVGNTLSGSGALTGAGDFWRTNTIARNTGVQTERQGLVTITAAVTSGTVTHSLPYTPNTEDISIYPASTWGNATKWWFDTLTATQFTVRCDIAPGANFLFAWSARLPNA